MLLARFPRIFLAHLPTPLEPLARLSQELGGPEIWIKRDDCTGLSTGGNKTRKLEFLMAEAQAQGADTVMTQGATQSNHARQTAAVRGETWHELPYPARGPHRQRRSELQQQWQRLARPPARRHTEKRSSVPDMNAEMEKVADRLRAGGRRVYTIPGGGSNPTGALGYVNCAFELVGQANDRGLVIDHLVHATGSAGTQAGLVTGLKAINAGIPLLGIGVRAPRPKQEENVFNLAVATAEKIGAAGVVKREDVVANTDYVGDGYGIPTASGLEAIAMFAELEGILLDPVYSAKGAAGLIDLIRKGQFKKGERLVFLHTGGSAALFGYSAAFDFSDRRVAAAE